MSDTISIAQAMNLATKLADEQKESKAQQVLRKILDIAPQHPQALHLLGVLMHRAGDVNQAINMLTQAIRIMPREVNFLANLCEMCRQRGRLEEAISYGERAIEENPNAVLALANLGICHYDQKDYDKAKALQERAIALNPKCIPALNNLGSIAKQSKSFADAQHLYEQVLAINPDHVESLSNLGAVQLSTEQLEESLKTLGKALKLHPRYAEAHCNVGATLMVLNRRPEAKKAFSNAIKLKADYFEAHVGMSRVSLSENDAPTALSLAQEAMRIRPDASEGFALLGDAQAALGLTEQAAESFRQALERDPENESAILSTGQLALELGDFDAAEARFREVLTFDPESLPAKTALVNARKVTSDDTSFNELIDLSKDIGNMYELKAMGLHFALGKGFDDRKEFTRAFEHYATGCGLKRKQLSYSTKSYAEFTRRVKAFFTPDRLSTMRSEACQDDTPIFILGMPRSGTTLTEQIIASHPDVFGAGELHHLSRISNQPNDWETAGFPAVFSGFNNDQLSLVGQKYIDGLKVHAPNARYITDKMPANYQFVGLIHLMLPNAKIIHVRRSPIDTCISNFMRLFANSSQPQSYDLTEIGLHYRQYHDLMAHWRQVLPEGAWYELDYEALVDDTEGQARAMLAYCGLPWDDQCLEFHKTKRGIKTASVTQVRQPIYRTSVERWRSYEAHLEPLFEALGPLAPKRSSASDTVDSKASEAATPKPQSAAKKIPSAKKAASAKAPTKASDSKAPAAKKPVPKKSAAKKPATQKPAAKKPAAKKPAAKAPPGNADDS